MTQDGDTIVNVLYDFNYTTDEGRNVRIREGEELLVIKKTNDDWWQVIREGDTLPFYAPKSYLIECTGETVNNLRTCKQEPINESVLFITNPLYSETSLQSTVVSDKNCNEVKTSSDEDVPEGVTVIHIPGVPVLYNASLEDQQHHGDTSLTEDSLSEDAKLDNTDDDYDEIESNDDDGTKSTDSAYNDRLQKVLEDDGEQSIEEEIALGPESPIYANFPLLSSVIPPIPQPGDSPQKALFNHWVEYVDESGRPYYYNSTTKETTWKPPRKGFENLPDSPENSPVPEAPPTPPRQPKPKLVRASQLDGESHSSSTDSLDLAELSPCTPPPSFDTILGSSGLIPLSPPTTPTLPKGWIQEISKATGEASYLHSTSKEKWFSSVDDNGRIYYYAESSNESHWELPEVPTDISSPTSSESSSSIKGKGVPPLPKSLNLLTKAENSILGDSGFFLFEFVPR